MIFRNPYKEIEGLMKRTHNPVNGYCECDDHVEVFVEKKLDMEEIYTHVTSIESPWEVDDIAPDFCNKKPVKVIEIGEVRAHAADTRKYEPVPGGCQIQPVGANFVGTLGIIGKAPYFKGTYLVGRMQSFKRILDMIGISYDMKPVIVTNAHVAQLDIMSQELGQPIAQPQGHNSLVGNVIWSSPFSRNKNFIDAAVASIDSPALINEILQLGGVRENRPVRVGEQVHKYGRTTKYTQGSCVREKAVVNIKFSDDLILPFHNVNLFSGMSSPGDSGSIIVAKEDGKAVSLLFAGSSTMTIGCPLAEVVKQSGVEIGN